MNTHNANTFTSGRDREVRTITAVISTVSVIGFASAVVPGVEDAINLALIVLGVLVAVIVAVRFGLRRLRERREDRADEITAAAWRAAHPRPPGDLSTVEASPGRVTRTGVA